MLRRILGNIVPTLDRAMERIPPHIRDIMQKASIALAALVALLVILSGINKGLRDARPAGYKLVERNRDLFYLQEMREEYAKKRKLVEDVEVDPLQFPSRQQPADDTRFVTMGRDTLGHLMGENEQMLQAKDPMRPREKSPGYLGDSYTVPRLTPDKKTIEDDEAPLTREKIGSRPAVAPAERAATPARPSPASPGAQPAPRDIFDGAQGSPAAVPSTAARPAGQAAHAAERTRGAPGEARKKLEFMD